MHVRCDPWLKRRLCAAWAAVFSAAALCGCVSYSGSSLKPGQSTLQDVRATMGEPAMQWAGADHSLQLSYPRGPAGFHSYMVYLDPAGRLQRIQNVMDPASFYRISPGMTEEQVLRILGPSVPSWTSYFAARRELVWEWRYCDEFSKRARFDVLFDGDSHTVRTSYGAAELCNLDPCDCGR
jgi:outer membrane protein assembly factor BamE (lipoprotein component of BamABCDE complex)